MKLFGFQITRQKAVVPPTDVIGLYEGGGWTPIIREPFSGAWQRNLELDQRGITAFSAVYACINIRARDIGKLRIKLMEQDANGIWSEIRGFSPYLGVLKKPNRFQTRIQFLEHWIASKLLYGNAYILKERDQRGVVRELYPLNACRVKPMIGEDGSVWYDIGEYKLAGIQTPVILPASEIIHDRCVTLFHPLVGVSPIYAAGSSAAQGTQIQTNSKFFFANMSAPSGHLSAPGKINDETAKRMREDFEAAKGGVNLGRILVTGDGINYEPFSMPATDAQLIEQLKWTVEDVARCFGVPLHKIMAGSVPQVGNMAALEQAYYTQTLQEDIESIELLLDEGLGLVDVDGKTYGTELDLDGLLRMDPKTRAERLEILGRAAVMSPDEMRATEDLPPVPNGAGKSPMAQQQNYSLEALAKRDAKPDPFAKEASPSPAPALPAPPSQPEQAAAEARALAHMLTKRFLELDYAAA